MISLLKRIFIDHWIRKILSLVLALILWFTVNQSLTGSKTVTSVGIRILNLPEKKTIPGLLSSGLLNKRTSLTIVGRKSVIDELSSKDIEIVIDATHIENDCVIVIDKKHIISLNPELNITDHIQKVQPKNLLLKIVPLFRERIDVCVTHPIGEPPKGFEFIDVWPYTLTLDIGGAEDALKKLKTRPLKLTLNLNDIPKNELEKLDPMGKKDVITFYVPDEWKVFNLPSISDKPLSINDPHAKLLHIDFIRSDTIPIEFEIPVQLFIPPDQPITKKPSLKIINSDIVQTVHGNKVLKKVFYAKGVSELFLKMIRDRISVSLHLPEKGKDLQWSIVFINPSLIEDRYVSHMMAETNDEVLLEIDPNLRQEHLRNRFRIYMSRLQLFTEENKPVAFNIHLQGDEILLQKAP